MKIRKSGFFILIFVIAMIFIQVVYADTASEQHTHCFCGKTDCDDTSVGHSILEKKSVVYKAFDGTDEIEYDTNNCAYIALPRDVILSDSLGEEGATLYICLNGHKLSSSNLEAPIVNNLKN